MGEILHSKVSAAADGPDTSKVRASDWNDGHEIDGEAINFDVGAASLLSRRAVTNAEDDLFNGSSLDGKWTQNGGTWTVGAIPGWVTATAGYLVQPVPAGTFWTIETEVLMPESLTSEYTGVGLFLSTSGTPSSAGSTRVVFIGRDNGLTSFRIAGDNNTNGSFSPQIFNQSTAAYRMQGHSFLRLAGTSATNYRVDIGMTRYDYQTIATFNPGITPTHFGLYGKGSYNGFYRL